MVNKLVSVLIPVYNVEKYVELAIRSIMNQTYNNLEIIIVDDGSNDNTYEILKKLAGQDSRIRLFKNPENMKIVNTLNFALSIANGKYIARMDGDDISEIHRIENKVKFLEGHPEFDLVGSSMVSINIFGDIIGRTICYADPFILLKTIKYVTPVGHIWVARKSVYDKLGGYREISGVEDYDFLLRMLSSSLKFTNIQDYYGYYVRLGRAGNTISVYGLKQLKMRRYVYKLFLERKIKGCDGFSVDELEKISDSNKLFRAIHFISNNALYRAIEYKGKKKYIRSLLYTLLSLSSFYQIRYLYERIIYRFIVIICKYKAYYGL